MSSIIPLPLDADGPPITDVRPLAYALDRMRSDLWAPILPGESFEDALTRREAARDILDELLAEYAGDLDTEAAAALAGAC